MHGTAIKVAYLVTNNKHLKHFFSLFKCTVFYFLILVIPI